MSTPNAVRLSQEDSIWLAGHAETLGVARSAVLKEAFTQYRARCEGQEPALTAPKPKPEAGYGECPKHEGGHVWASPRVDSRRRCVHCGKPGRGDATKNEEGNLQDAAAARAEFFSKLRPTMISGSGKPGLIADEMKSRRT